MLWVPAQDALSYLQCSAARCQTFCAIKFTPPKRGFSGKAACVHSHQGKNPLAGMIEQWEREQWKIAQTPLCSYWNWREYHLPHPLPQVSWHVLPQDILERFWKRALPSDKKGGTRSHGFMNARRHRLSPPTDNWASSLFPDKSALVRPTPTSRAISCCAGQVGFPPSARHQTGIQETPPGRLFLALLMLVLLEGPRELQKALHGLSLDFDGSPPLWCY